ncbi:hypothetical protein ABZ897_15865 [Nonomuraea sp. NPDC046802]|uniref:hypothetical protein n=1 Tax=Nonomuraea sp. NPDC046802 TaxID=3154919 RepID=UPI0033F3D0E4
MSRHLAPLILAHLDGDLAPPPEGHIAVYPGPDGVLLSARSDGTSAPVSGAGPQGPPGPGVLPPYVIDGPVTVSTGTYRLYNDTGRPWTITAVRATVVAPPTGSGISVDVNVDGASIFAAEADQPTIPDGGTTAKSTTFATAAVPDGAHLTVDVDTIGTTTPGAKLSVQVTVTA